jgi:Cu(I)/Ag(I) efflux system protein CusF
MNARQTSLALALLTASTLACAGGKAAASAPQTADASVAMTEGEVRKVDLDTRKITLRHAEIKSLGMPGMTMVFQVKDPALLAKVKAGDKVRFTAEKINGGYSVTNIEAVK